METSNYRPVRILSCLSKVFEKTLSHSCLRSFIIFSLRICLDLGRHMGAKMYYFILLTMRTYLLDDRNVTLATLTDLSKAFDCLR